MSVTPRVAQMLRPARAVSDNFRNFPVLAEIRDVLPGCSGAGILAISTRRSLLDPLTSTHQRAEDIGDRDAAVGVLVGLQHRDQHARAGDGGVVEGVAEMGRALSAGASPGAAAVAEVETSGLEVAQCAAAV